MYSTVLAGSLYSITPVVCLTAIRLFTFILADAGTRGHRLDQECFARLG